MTRLTLRTSFLCFGLLVAFSLLWMAHQPVQEPPLAVNDPIEQKVDALLAKMELVDKVGEMTQVTIDAILKRKGNQFVEPHQVDPEKLKDVVLTNRVGSIMNIGGHAYSLDEWQNIITQIQGMAMTEKPTKIPVLYGIDAVHGTNYTIGATLFPQQIGMAASWNTELVKQSAEICAYETRASYIPWNFSPVMDIGRDPRWSRFWETFGEDVLLVSEMGKAMVEGYQGDDLSSPYQVAACLKHFLGYSLPVTGKDRTQAWIPERQLREYVIPPFAAAMEAGAATIMVCSGEFNGIPVHANEWVLTDLLRGELGFEGLAVSDWEDIHYLHKRHRVAKDYKEAIKISVNAGLDMSMTPYDLDFPKLLKQLVEEGAVPMSRIDAAVRRILRNKIELGLFEQPVPEQIDFSKFKSKAYQQASLALATESLTLLKNNDKQLPLDKGQKVLVTGPTANSLGCMNGGWTGTWQGNNPNYNTKGKMTIVEAIQEKIGPQNVSYEPGTKERAAFNIEKAVEEAKSAGLAIICLGEDPYTEKPGDRDDLTLPQAQLDLVKAIAATNTPIVIVLVEGRPRIINAIEADANAILMAYLPGDEGGKAIADVLFGDANPSGKLPFTYPRFVHSIIPYDHRGTDIVDPGFGVGTVNPQFTFGHGLSYTTFDYSNLKLSTKAININQTLQVSVDVKNTGERAGKEVVQLYIADKVASITPSLRRLRGFEKITLAPGESKTVTFDVTAQDLAFVGLDNEWITEPGEFEVMIADLEGKFEVK